ncbi:MAG TPA: zf-HC2 domain-containing protein [Acidobacteriota bacterium]|nr:zf-HC2 domain-containing protein [Acidobacteriota bacterium]
MHLEEGIFRAYVEGAASDRERQEVNEHLKSCGDCKQFLAFVQDFSGAAKDIAESEIAADEPHPSTTAIIDYEEGKLDAETSFHLRAHMLYCDDCAETYYLLKRMRAPSRMEVIVGLLRSAKEFLLQPIDVSGMGEFRQAPVVVARGEGSPQQTIEVRQRVSAADAAVIFSLEPNAGRHAGVTLRAALQPPQPWTATLRNANGQELVSIPLKVELQVLHRAMSPDIYTVQVLADQGPIAECRLDIRVSDETAPAHRDH